MARAMLNRRQFGAGIAATAGAFMRVPALAATPKIPPLPVHALCCCNVMVQENARRLERLAHDVLRIEQRIGTDDVAAAQWPHLYDDMVYEAYGLREKGITGSSPLERELLDWVAAIYPDDDTRARQPRIRITGLSRTYRALHRELEQHLFTMARNAPREADKHVHITVSFPRTAAYINARSDANKAAWRIFRLIPRNQSDVEAHRLAVEVLYSQEFVFVQRYST